MNKSFILAALFGTLTFDQVMARHHHHEVELIDLDDEDEEQAELEPEELVNIGGQVYAMTSVDLDYQRDLDRAMRELDEKVIIRHAKKALKNAAKKIQVGESSSDTDSSTDAERHASFKSKERKRKHLLKVYHPAIRVPEHLLSKHAKKQPTQTVDSLLKAAEQAKKQQADMEAKGKELAAEVKKLRDEFEKKDKEAKEQMVKAHALDDKASSAKLALKRHLERLENTRHEAAHEAAKEATEGVAKSKTD